MKTDRFDYVRPHKAIDLSNQYAKINQKDDLKTEIIENGYIIPLRKIPEDGLLFGRGGVVDKDGCFVELSSIAGRIHGGYDFKRDGFSTCDNTVVYCGYLVNQWGHFLIEAINRLWFFVENQELPYKYVFIIEENTNRVPNGNYKEFFDLLGISDRIEIINKPCRYRRIIVPECSFSYQTTWSIEYRRIFDAVIKNAMESKPDTDEYRYDKIFLSRSAFPKAKYYEIGLDMLDSFFENNGYKIIYPEKLSLRELVYYLQGAKECAAESGTTPHNILFGYPCEDLTILERQCVLNPIQQAIDIIREVNVTYIDSHYMIYPVNQGSGPFYLAYNDYLKLFAEDRTYNPPDEVYLSDGYIKKSLKKWMNVYKAENYYLWGMEGWETRCAETMFEAYTDSLKVLGPYLSGEKAFKPSQLLEKNRIKRMMKRILTGA